MADVLAPEICFLQLYKFCAHMFSSKLASGKVERCAYGTKRERRLGWIPGLIAVSRLLGGGRLRLLLKRIRVRRVRLGEGIHGQRLEKLREGDEAVGVLSD